MARLWRRPQPTVRGPDRSFGGYYRTSDRQLKGKDLRGVPLQTAEDAAVAAVRLGYQVVDAQIERGMDMARRLRGAAARAGSGDPANLLDNAERLISRGLLLGLEFLEGAAADPRTPIMRLLSAQFRMLGATLGLTTDAAPTVDTAPKREPEAGHPGASTPSAAARPHPKDWRTPRVRHTSDSSKRAVTIQRWEMDRDLPSAASYDLAFHALSGVTDQALHATLTVAPNAPATLEVTTVSQQPAGRWRAAVCIATGEQVGIVELEL